MKKILLISDGVVGRHFIERVINTYTSENIYYVVQIQPHAYKDINPARFKFYEFDPTSLSKLSNLLKMEFVQVIIAMDSAFDVEQTIKNIRTVKPQLRTVVLDQWDLDLRESNVVRLNANEMLASHLIDHLPNVPVIAQNVGLGEGEIMEVLVPFGSSFVYRHLGVIEQKNWRIVAMYRNGKLLMPSRRRMIQPNDLLLLVGEPGVLKSVYRAIKRELGQFPAPFGSSLYLFIDMARDSNETITHLLKQALFIQKKLKQRLRVRVVNPGDVDQLSVIKSHGTPLTDVDICYKTDLSYDMILDDIKLHHAGLVMVSKGLFCDSVMRQTLFEGSVPVLKLANKPLGEVKETVTVLSDNRDLEKVSTTIFDISSQLGFNLQLFNYTGEHQEEKEQVIEHFNNLSTIFSKSIKVIEQTENPIRSLKKRENFLHCLPFTKKMLPHPLFSVLSTDSEKLYHRLGEYHQIFIPVQNIGQQS